jgi:hypothetical protein
VSESPFRPLCRAHGADVVVTEFLLGRGDPARERGDAQQAPLRPDERPIGVQIFGADPQAMADAAAFVTDVFQPEFVGHQLRLPGQEGRQAQRRLGVPEGHGARRRDHPSRGARHAPPGHGQDAQRLERGDPRPGGHRAPHAGRRRAAFTLHARTRTQMYTGHARWEEIAAVVDALDVPVIGNGDVKTPDDVVRMLGVTGAAGVMIGRGSYGQPWIFDQAKDLMAGRPMRPAPSVAERFAVALDHARMVQAYEADAVGAAIEFRSTSAGTPRASPSSGRSARKLPRGSARSVREGHLRGLPRAAGTAGAGGRRVAGYATPSGRIRALGGLRAEFACEDAAA